MARPDLRRSSYLGAVDVDHSQPATARQKLFVAFREREVGDPIGDDEDLEQRKARGACLEVSSVDGGEDGLED